VAALFIDRLTLQVPGLSATDGRRLALQVARGLGAARVSGGARALPAVRLDITAATGAGVDELARQVVAAVLERVAGLP
jgi:hypothetical protein